jgi:hypothetical protein
VHPYVTKLISEQRAADMRAAAAAHRLARAAKAGNSASMRRSARQVPAQRPGPLHDRPAAVQLVPQRVAGPARSGSEPQARSDTPADHDAGMCVSARR